MRQSRHHHDRTSLTLVFQGSLHEVVGDAHEDAGPLSVVFKPAGTEHANRIGPLGAATLQLEFEPDFISGITMDEPGEWAWAHGGTPARRFLALFASWTGTDEGPLDLEDRLFDVLAGLVGQDVDGSGLPPAWLTDLVEEVEDTFRRPRSVRDLARTASIHPVALARAHRRHFGCSLTDRVRLRRVREAVGLLGADSESLSSVAFATGFADQSHLTRVFKRETGLTPGSLRSLLRS